MNCKFKNLHNFYPFHNNISGSELLIRQKKLQATNLEFKELWQERLAVQKIICRKLNNENNHEEPVIVEKKRKHVNGFQKTNTLSNWWRHFEEPETLVKNHSPSETDSGPLKVNKTMHN